MIQSLAWELPYATGEAPKRQNTYIHTDRQTDREKKIVLQEMRDKMSVGHVKTNSTMTKIHLFLSRIISNVNGLNCPVNDRDWQNG